MQTKITARRPVQKLEINLVSSWARLQTEKATLQGKRQRSWSGFLFFSSLSSSWPGYLFSNSKARCKPESKVACHRSNPLHRLRQVPCSRDFQPLIFSKASQIHIFPLSVSGLRQELFPDAITAKRSLSDSDHSLPGLLSIHCCFVDLKERVLHIWVGWR